MRRETGAIEQILHSRAHLQISAIDVEDDCLAGSTTSWCVYVQIQAVLAIPWIPCALECQLYVFCCVEVVSLLSN